MTIIQAIGFMVLGGVIVEVFEIHAWRRYQQGKRENQLYQTSRPTGGRER